MGSRIGVTCQARTLFSSCLSSLHQHLGLDANVPLRVHVDQDPRAVLVDVRFCIASERRAGDVKAPPQGARLGFP